MAKTNVHDGFSPSAAASHVIDEGTIASANREAVDRIKAAWPVLLEPVLARDVTGLSEGELGHACPPFVGLTPPPVVLNALAGAAVHEGWAGNVAQARRMVLDGSIRLRPTTRCRQFRRWRAW